MKTTKQLTPPSRKAGRKKFVDEQGLADLATPYFKRLLAKHPANMRALFSRAIFDLGNRSQLALTSRQALVFVLGCNGFSHRATADCLRMNESTCVYIFRRACQRYIDDVDFRELCNRIAGIEQTTQTQHKHNTNKNEN